MSIQKSFRCRTRNRTRNPGGGTTLAMRVCLAAIPFHLLHQSRHLALPVKPLLHCIAIAPRPLHVQFVSSQPHPNGTHSAILKFCSGVLIVSGDRYSSESILETSKACVVCWCSGEGDRDTSVDGAKGGSGGEKTRTGSGDKLTSRLRLCQPEIAREQRTPKREARKKYA